MIRKYLHISPFYSTTLYNDSDVVKFDLRVSLMTCLKSLSWKMFLTLKVGLCKQTWNCFCICGNILTRLTRASARMWSPEISSSGKYFIGKIINCFIVKLQSIPFNQFKNEIRNSIQFPSSTAWIAAFAALLDLRLDLSDSLTIARFTLIFEVAL